MTNATRDWALTDLLEICGVMTKAKTLFRWGGSDCGERAAYQAIRQKRSIEGRCCRNFEQAGYPLNRAKLVDEQ
jgi:hypothetical protein